LGAHGAESRTTGLLASRVRKDLAALLVPFILGAGASTWFLLNPQINPPSATTQSRAIGKPASRTGLPPSQTAPAKSRGVQVNTAGIENRYIKSALAEVQRGRWLREEATAISSDGQYVAVARLTGNVGAPEALVYLKDIGAPDQSRPVGLLELEKSLRGLRPQAYPLGFSNSSLLFASLGTGIFGHEIQSGSTQVLVMGNVWAPAMSPDKEFIAYMAGDGRGGTDLKLYSLKSPPERTIAQLPERNPKRLNWSKSGKAVFFEVLQGGPGKRPEGWICDVASRETRKLCDSPFDFEKIDAFLERGISPCESSPSLNAGVTTNNNPKAEVREVVKQPELSPRVQNSAETKLAAGMTFVLVPSGAFQMGSDAPNGQSDERPSRQVVIRDGFWLGQYEVTQAEWHALMGSNPSAYRGSDADRCPVESVSFLDCMKFIDALNRKQEGIFRLPTEAEWEYACRAGSVNGYPGGGEAANLDSIAWCVNNSGARPHPVGSKRPNAWGLYDMPGSVYEWCEDYWQPSYSGAPTDGNPVLRHSKEGRVRRGGSWAKEPQYMRSAFRGNADPNNRRNDVGLRLVWEPLGARKLSREQIEMPIEKVVPIDVSGEWHGEWLNDGKTSVFHLSILRADRGSLIAKGTANNWSLIEHFEGVQDRYALRFEGKSVVPASSARAYALDTLVLTLSTDGQTLNGTWNDAGGRRGKVSLKRSNHAMEEDISMRDATRKSESTATPTQSVAEALVVNSQEAQSKEAELAAIEQQRNERELERARMKHEREMKNLELQRQRDADRAAKDLQDRLDRQREEERSAQEKREREEQAKRQDRREKAEKIVDNVKDRVRRARDRNNR
jgi:formylglycine-generating enzyme required for sulfatase activity